MRTTFALALVCALSQTAYAASVYSPTLPGVSDPENWMGLVFDIQPAPQIFDAEISSGSRISVIDNTVYMPRHPFGPIADNLNGRLSLYLFSVQPNPFVLNLRPEADNMAIGTYNVAVRTPDGQPLTRMLTVTAPGYSRSFQATFIPEPASAFLLLACVPFSVRSWRASARGGSTSRAVPCSHSLRTARATPSASCTALR